MRLAQRALCNNPQQLARRASARLNEGKPDTPAPTTPSPLDLSFHLRRTDTTMPTLSGDNGNSGVATSVSSRLASSLSEGVYTNNRTAVLQGSYSVFDFGADQANRARARYQENAAAAALDASQQALLRQVVEAYAAALSAPNGRIDVTDTAPLAALLGLDPLQPVLLAPPSVVWLEPPGRWESWWSLAEERPDLREARAHVQADRESITAARAGTKGKVGLALSVSPGYSNITGRSDAESLNLSYTLPLGDLFPVAPAVDTALAHVMAGQDEAEALLQRARTEVRLAWEAYANVYRLVMERLRSTSAGHRPLGAPWSAESTRTLGAAMLARTGLLQAVGRLDLATLSRPLDGDAGATILGPDTAATGQPAPTPLPKGRPAPRPTGTKRGGPAGSRHP